MCGFGHCARDCSAFFCALYMFSGLGFVAMGLWFVYSDAVKMLVFGYLPQYIAEDIDGSYDTYRLICVLFFLLGAYLTVTGVVGIVGSSTENRGALIAFSVLGAIGFVLTIWAGAYGVIRFEDWHKQPYGDPNVNEYYGEAKYFSLFIDHLQIQRSCCGMGHVNSDGVRQYKYSKFSNKTGFPIPWSCCRMTERVYDINKVLNLTGCMIEAENYLYNSYRSSDFFYTYGCWSVEWWVEWRMITVFGLSFGFVLLQFIAMIIAGCWNCTLKEKRQKIQPDSKIDESL